MPPLRPRIGIEQVDARKRRVGQPVDEFAGVAEIEANIGKLVCVDRCERLGDGIDKSVGADETGAGISLRLRDQVLGATESDLEPHIIDWSRK